MLILSWVFVIGLDINISPLLDVITNTWSAILLLILGLATVILLVLYKIKFIVITACIILSIKLLGTIAFWGWLIYGIYRLWLLDQKDPSLHK